MHPTLHRQFPSPPTRLIGRDAELSDIVSLLDDPHCRLLTLAGPGGIGKTRLAIEVAQQAARQYDHGAYVVELVGVEDPVNVVPAIATTLGFQFYESDDPPRVQLVNYLRNKHLLLVLDNFEHLLSASVLLGDILQASPGVKLLVTSRVVLNLAWEYIYDVPGLRVPDAGEGADLENYGAIQLFTARARRVQHHFALEREHECVVLVCQMVEGMPLGLELAASWLRMMSCTDLTARLADGLAFLTNRQGQGDRRHHSLQAVFEQSWALLTPTEQSALARLAVFSGGFSWKAAEAVTGESLDVLSALVDQSLVRIAADGQYDLHELVRQFAAAKLTGEPDAHFDALDRHASFYCGMLESSLPGLLNGGVQDALATMDQNLDNIRAAWEHANRNRQAPLVLQADEPLFHYLHFRGRLIEAEHVFRQALSHWSDPAGKTERLVEARLQARLGTSIKMRDALEDAEDMLRHAIGVLRDLGDDRARAFAQTWLTNTLDGRRLYTDEAIALGEDSLVIWGRLEDHYGVATTSRHLGWVSAHLGRLDEAVEWMQQSLAAARRAGHGYVVCGALHGLGKILELQAHFSKARTWYEQCIAQALAGGFPDVARHALADLSQMAERMGDYQLARQAAREGLAQAEGQGDPLSIANLLNRLGWVHFRLGSLDEAEGFFQREQTLSTDLNISHRQISAHMGPAIIAAGRGQFEEARRLYEHGLAMARELNDLAWQVGTLINLSYNAVMLEDYAAAVRYGKEALAVQSDYDGHLHHLAHAHLHMAHGLTGLGELDAARTSYLDALRHQAHHRQIPSALETIAGLAYHVAAHGDLEYAVELAALARHHAMLPSDSRPIPDRLLAELEAELPEEVFAAAVARGQALDVDQVIEAFLSESHAESHALAPSSAGQRKDALAESLTEREREVLALVAQGKSNRQIAAELFLALGTVKTHIHNICAKLGTQNRTEAVAVARESGLI